MKEDIYFKSMFTMILIQLFVSNLSILKLVDLRTKTIYKRDIYINLQ